MAFMKLAGKMSSRPTILPGRHAINGGLLATNMATMGAFVAMAPASPTIAAGALAANTVLSFVKGYTTTAAIGGADMRKKEPAGCQSSNIHTRWNADSVSNFPFSVQLSSSLS